MTYEQIIEREADKATKLFFDPAPFEYWMQKFKEPLPARSKEIRIPLTFEAK